MNQECLTVSELNQIIKKLIDGEPILSKVCVRGELSNYKIYPSGHHYFTLKDAESSLRCVMFKSSGPTTSPTTITTTWATSDSLASGLWLVRV